MNLKLTTAAILAVSLMASCAKETTPTPATKSTTSGFTWSENGGAEITADSAFFESSYKTIKAFKTGKFIEINLEAGIPATYTINSSNAISMLVGSGTSAALYTASTGSLVISANASAKMSGTFTSVGTGASITKLDGKFTDIAVR